MRGKSSMKRKSDRKPQTIWQTLLCAAAVSLGVTAALAALLAAMVTGGMLPQQATAAAAVIAAGIGAFAGALYAACRVEEKKLIAAALSAAAYVFLLLMGNLLFVDAPPLGIGRVGLSCLCAATAAGLLAARSRKRPHGARRR